MMAVGSRSVLGKPPLPTMDASNNACGGTSEEGGCIRWMPIARGAPGAMADAVEPPYSASPSIHSLISSLVSLQLLHKGPGSDGGIVSFVLIKVIDKYLGDELATSSLPHNSLYVRNQSPFLSLCKVHGEQPL